MKLALAFALLAFCCGCGDRPAKSDAAGPHTNNAIDQVDEMLPSNSSMPFDALQPDSNALPAEPAPAAPPDTAGPAQSDRFIVCPGDRRCPRR